MEPAGKRQKGHRSAYSYSNGDSNRRDPNASPRSTVEAFGSGRREYDTSPRPMIWSPRETPFQGPRGVKLSFNYWINYGASHQVLTSDVRKLVMANLTGKPVPSFAEEDPKARKVVVACLTGLNMMAADACVTSEACPFLRSCSSVPVRHSFESNRGGYPRALDVQPSAALMLWEEKPTVPQHEIAAMSVTKLFTECEVTFSGTKSPGWKDDVSFLSSARTNDPPPRGDAAEANSHGDDADDSSSEVPPVCHGSFWRNLNHDRGRFTLDVEDDDGMAGSVTWVLSLHWDRWETEILHLKGGGGLLRFEDKDQTLSLRLTCARRRTDLEERTSVSSSRPASLDATTADAPSRPSSLPDGVASAPSESPQCAKTADGSGTQSSDCLDGQAPKEEDKGVTVEIKTTAESLIRIPLESLDPEEFCLKVGECYRLNIPVRVSAEGPGYVSTDEPMPPRWPRRKDHGGDGPAARRAGGDTGSADREHGMSMARDKLGGRSTFDDVGLEGFEGLKEDADEVRKGEWRKQRQGSMSSSWRNQMDHNYAEQSDSNKGEDMEEAGRCGKKNKRGAITDAVVSIAVGARRREAGASGLDSTSKGRKRYRGPEATKKDRQSSEDEETVGTAAGRVVESPHASTSGLQNGGTLHEAEENLDEGEEGEIVMPAPQRSSLKRPSTPPTPPSPPMSSGPEDEEISCGLQSSAPSRAFVSPSADLLFPIPSGPRKGAVILGLDCEMVYTKAGLELARVTFVNVKGQIVYDELVQPTELVTDYNTQFSGITYEMLKEVTQTLSDVQAEILEFVGAETYLVGHSLESDMRALKIVHRRLIDTSELYPSARGAPFKNGLRLLSQTVLGREIQAGLDGHDSREDALAALELALLKIYRGPSFGLPPVWAAKMNPPKESIFESLERRELEPLSCKVCGDYQAKASAEHPPRTPLWSVFNNGYRQEQDAVWTARSFGEKASSGGTPSDTVAKVTVDAADFPTAGDMFRDALESLREKKPSLLWLDMPCDCNNFDMGEEPASTAMGTSEMRKETAEANDHGPSNGRYWKSLVEVDRAMARLYDTMEEGTLLAVLCQGAVSRVVSLLARKTKSKWSAGKLEKKDYIAGQKRAHSQISAFDHRDEEDLARAASDCLDGMCFFAVK